MSSRNVALTGMAQGLADHYGCVVNVAASKSPTGSATKKTATVTESPDVFTQGKTGKPAEAGTRQLMVLEQQLGDLFAEHDPAEKMGSSPWSKFKSLGKSGKSGETLQAKRDALKTVISQLAQELNNSSAQLEMMKQERDTKHQALEQVQKVNKELQAKSNELDRITAHDMPGKVNHLKGVVESMLANNEALVEENRGLQKEKEDAAKKLKEMSQKLNDETEVRDREIKRLQNELRKESKKDEAKAVKQISEVEEKLAAKAVELKTLQGRFDIAKKEADAAKSNQKALKDKLDETGLALEKKVTELQNVSRNLGMAKQENDDLRLKLGLTEQEMSMFHQMYNAQMDTNLAAQRKHYNQEQAWPRVAFSVRGSKLLHSTVCSSVEASHCTPTEYHSHKALEAVMLKGGMLLCKSCVESGF